MLTFICGIIPCTIVGILILYGAAQSASTTLVQRHEDHETWPPLIDWYNEDSTL